MTMLDAEAQERFTFVLGEIARGRCDNARPLAAEVSRQMAREVLGRHSLEWPMCGDGEEPRR